MEAMIIREMCMQDLEQVAAIEKNTFSEPWSAEGFASSLVSKDTLYLVAEQEGKILGYCGYLQSFDEADITNVAVDAPYRNYGIAGQMLKQLMEQGRQNGIARFTLEVRVSNAAAIHLYEKLGFFSVGIRKRFYSKPVEDAMIMWTEEVQE